MTNHPLLTESRLVPQHRIDAFRASHYAAVAPAIRRQKTHRLLSGIQAQFEKADQGVLVRVAPLASVKP